MRPTIDIESVGDLGYKTLRVLFEGIAQAKHYKAIYVLQREKNINVPAAIREFFKNEEFVADIKVFLDDQANYVEIFKSAIVNFTDRSFKNEDIPLRDADFKVTEDKSYSWFWINERIEINFSGTRFYIHKLIVDPKSNVIIRSNVDCDDWEAYDEDSSIGVAYKSYLADQQLLGDG